METKALSPAAVFETCFHMPCPNLCELELNQVHDIIVMLLEFSMLEEGALKCVFHDRPPFKLGFIYGKKNKLWVLDNDYQNMTDGLPLAEFLNGHVKDPKAQEVLMDLVKQVEENK